MCARRAPGGGTARGRAPGRAAGDYPAATTPRVVASRPWSPACRVTLVPPQVTRVPDAMVFRQVTRVPRMVQLVDRGAPAVTLVPDAVPVWQVMRVPRMVQLVERVPPQVTRVP
ncbi:hypothetical protein [Spongiactinospora sp. 9N601]|uniref:hypothetical protein n=1 Tax=Spongiactinospora sp. 9N601 TaxID=3375149 RepID=UPI0037CBFCA3